MSEISDTQNFDIKITNHTQFDIKQKLIKLQVKQDINWKAGILSFPMHILSEISDTQDFDIKITNYTQFDIKQKLIKLQDKQDVHWKA